MCGIAGALVFRDSSFVVTKPYVGRMRDTMLHRGPDGSGLWISPDGRLGLGHLRLAIIDLSESAAQPMSNEDGTLQIVFNGEIYNHEEIRRELEARGRHRWKTDHSDTEVILHAFEEWGIDCLEKFRGMFAIALWDSRKRELWLVRDRVGIKPLYYSVHHGRITFASEIKALLEDPEQKREVHEEALYHYLTFLATPAPQTLFKGIKKLPGATWLRVREDGSLREHRYWDVLDHTEPLVGLDEREIAERVLVELRTAVKLRKVSDVPVGVYLSGGIDSSTNALLFSEGERGPIRTFTIGYEGEYRSYRNELEYARRVADLAGAEYHEMLLNVDHLIDFLPRMVRMQDEPIADPVCVPVYYVSKLARDNGVIVCHSGEGADELFCGYPGWKRSLMLQRLNDLSFPSAAKRLGLGVLQALGRDGGVAYEMLRRGADGLPVFWGGAEAFTEEGKRRVLSRRLRQECAGMTSWSALEPFRRRFEAKAWERSHLNWMTYLDLNFRLPELVLMRVDKMSMGASIEGRVPFLDHKLVELAMSIPTSVKIRGGVTKRVLKQAVRGIVPDDIIDRKKQGFGVPVYEWFLGRFGEWTKRELKELCASTDFFDIAEIDRLIETGAGAKTWYLLNFALWYKEFIR